MIYYLLNNILFYIFLELDFLLLLNRLSEIPYYRQDILLPGFYPLTEEYFFHNIHGDLDRVIRSIRENHQNATESAPIERPASNDKKMQRLLQSMKYKSNPIEEFWRYFCEELQIDYDKLLDDEHDTMKRIFKKSKLLKSFPSHKNKARK